MTLALTGAMFRTYSRSPVTGQCRTGNAQLGAVAVTVVALLGFAGLQSLGAAMHEDMIGRASADAQLNRQSTSAPAVQLSGRSFAGVLSSIRGALAPAVTFARGSDGVFREVASTTGGRFANQVASTAKHVLQSDADVLRWLGEKPYQRVEQIRFKREIFSFDPMVVASTDGRSITVTVPAKQVADSKWLSEHLAQGLAEPFTDVKLDTKNYLLSQRTTSDLIVGGWATGGAAGGAVGYVADGLPMATLTGSVAATVSMFAFPIVGDVVAHIGLERALSRLARAARGKLRPGDVLRIEVPGRTLENLRFTLEPDSFPMRRASAETISLEGLRAEELLTELANRR